MARLSKQRKNKKYNYSKDRKRSWKNKNKLPTIRCGAVRDAWDEKKSVEQNMLDMGLAADSNKSIRIPNTKEFLVQSMEVVMAKKRKKKNSSKKFVSEDLEKEANTPQQTRLQLADPQLKYCVYMMEKYQDDYKAMARDPKNFNQDTPKQIKKQINTFKNTSEQYKEYLQSKGESAMDL